MIAYVDKDLFSAGRRVPLPPPALKAVVLPGGLCIQVIFLADFTGAPFESHQLLLGG